MGDGTGVWMYAIAKHVEPRRLAALTGVGGEPVRAVAAAGLTAVVGTVNLAELGPEALREKLNDLPTLDRIARAHHDITDTVARQGTALPARLATIYHDDERVAAMLTERNVELQAALGRIAERTEWGIKVLATNSGTPPGEAADETAGAGAGTRYLLRRRAQLAAAERAQAEAVAAAEDVHQTLTRHAVGSRVQNTPPSGTQALLNGSYLVEDRRADEFTEAVAALAKRHPSIGIQLTGPWPAYSFSDLRDGAGEGGDTGA